MNTTNCSQMLVNIMPLQDVEEFTYLGSKVATTGDSDKYTNTWISKTNQTFDMHIREYFSKGMYVEGTSWLIKPEGSCSFDIFQ